MMRANQLVLLALFLLIVAGISLGQAVIDLKWEGEQKPVALTLFDARPNAKNLRAYETRLEESSFFAGKLLRPAYQLARYFVLRSLGEKATVGRAAGWYFYTPDLKYLVEPWWRVLAKPGTPDPVDTIVDFARQLRRRNIELLVVPVPGKPSIYPERLVRGTAAEPAIAAHTQRLHAELRRRGVESLDLHQVFLQARARPASPSLYLQSDTHWSGHGARLAAEALAGRIKASGWYRSLPRTRRYVRQEVKLQRRGDVLRMSQLPLQERIFAPEQVTCFRVLQAKNGEPFVDPEQAAEAPVLYLGDSFARIYETDEPEAAGVIANLAYELQQPIASIVNDGGASTLVRQELARDPSRLQGKRLVIWSFVERDLRFGLQGWQPLPIEL